MPLTKEQQETMDEIDAGLKTINEKNEDRFKKLEEVADKAEVERKRLVEAVGANPIENKAQGFHYEVKSDYDKAFFDVYLRQGQKFLAPDEAKALLDGPGEEKAALIIGSDPAAGYLTSIEYGREVIKAITEFSPIRAEATVRETSGTEINFPKRTALPDTHWVGEISERTEDESLEFAMEKLTPHEMISFKKVSLQQLEDAYFNLANELGGAFGEALGLKEGTGFILGTGTLQPEGILVNPDVGFTETLAASVIGANDIMAFPYKVSRGYRKNGKWYLNSTTIAAIRLLRADVATEGDGLGPFLWQNSLIAGQPPTLAGYPVVDCPDMPDVAIGTYPVVFGDMRKAYMIADRIAFQVQELRERYAEYGLVGYIARKRVDGQVVLAEAIHKMKIQST